MEGAVKNILRSVRILIQIMFVSAIVFESMAQATGEITGRCYKDAGWITVKFRNGIITDVIKLEKRPKSAIGDAIIAPGLIDTQVNGYSSISFSREDLTTEGVRKVTESMWKEGVTTYLPTVVSSPHERIIHSFTVLARAKKEDPLINLSIPGFFLEGPYISPVDGFRGAHTKEYVRLPDWDEFSEYIEASDNQIILIGLAPELEGALPFIEKCVDAGIKVSLAHHNGSAETIHKAAELGASVVTHLGNGCANMIHRHENPLWPQLADERLTPSIIADGHHLRPEEVKTFFKVKGPENLMLVSDATMLAGMPPGNYTWDGKTVVMTEDGMLKYPEQNVLAGASFPVSRGVINTMKFTGCSLAEAIRMAASTPAKVFDLEDRGMIVKGKRADMILFNLEEDRMGILRTYVTGELVYASE